MTPVDVDLPEKFNVINNLRCIMAEKLKIILFYFRIFIFIPSIYIGVIIVLFLSRFVSAEVFRIVFLYLLILLVVDSLRRVYITIKYKIGR